MTQYLPPNLLALFAPRDPIPFLPPPDKLPHTKKTQGYTGVSAFLKHFEDPANTPDPVRISTREERLEQKRKLQAEAIAFKLEQDIALWTPHTNPLGTSDSYKTLFVARIKYDTSESKLRREFEQYGPIRKIVIAEDKETGKQRGYAFIEYERERDMHTAYKRADGKKIGGRRVLVDVERGRTVKGWFPRRLGGGLGGTRRGGPDMNTRHCGRELPRMEDRHGEHEERDRERERPERPERRRSRSRSHERRPRRSRSRERQHRNDRHRRDRSRERNRDHDANAVNEHKAEGEMQNDVSVPEPSERKERRRSRSRDRERRRRRSRSRERRRRDRDDKDKDRDMRKQDRNDKDERMKPENQSPPNVNEEQPFNNNGNSYEGNDFNNAVEDQENSEGYSMY